MKISFEPTLEVRIDYEGIETAHLQEIEDAITSAVHVIADRVQFRWDGTSESSGGRILLMYVTVPVVQHDECGNQLHQGITSCIWRAFKETAERLSLEASC